MTKVPTPPDISCLPSLNFIFIFVSFRLFFFFLFWYVKCVQWSKLCRLAHGRGPLLAFPFASLWCLNSCKVGVATFLSLKCSEWTFELHKNTYMLNIQKNLSVLISFNIKFLVRYNFQWKSRKTKIKPSKPNQGIEMKQLTTNFSKICHTFMRTVIK